jgi:hypothetical protein
LRFPPTDAPNAGARDWSQHPDDDSDDDEDHLDTPTREQSPPPSPKRQAPPSPEAPPPNPIIGHARPRRPTRMPIRFKDCVVEMPVGKKRGVKGQTV